LTASTTPTYGIDEGQIPMSSVGFRLPIAWMQAIRARAAINGTDQSKILREAITLWAEQNDVPLNGY
jgi:hypothetical protein